MPPYPLPDGWRTKAAKPVRVWVALIWAMVAAALAALAGRAVLQGDIGGGLVFTSLFGVAGLGLGVGYERAGGERGMPEMLNAVTLSKATVQPPDSWVHFFREAGPGRWLTTCFAITGTFCSTALVWVIVLAGVSGGEVWVFVVGIPLLLGALVVALAGWIAVVLRWRHASFGRRPIGISLGRHGLIRYYLDDRVDVWPWESIASVRTRAAAVDPTTGDFMPVIVITPVSGAPDPTEPGKVLEEDEYDLSGYQAHAWLIYTAIRFWRENPALRGELSTTFAQQRMADWRRAMQTPPPQFRRPLL